MNDPVFKIGSDSYRFQICKQQKSFPNLSGQPFVGLSNLAAGSPKTQSCRMSKAPLPVSSRGKLQSFRRSQNCRWDIQLQQRPQRPRQQFQSIPPSKLLPILSSQWSGVRLAQNPDKEKRILSPKKVDQFFVKPFGAGRPWIVWCAGSSPTCSELSV